MYVNYLLRIRERNQVGKNKYSKGPLRKIPLNFSAMTSRRYSKQRPRRLPPIHLLNTSMPSIMEPYSGTIERYSSYSSDEDSFEESYSRLAPKFN